MSYGSDYYAQAIADWNMVLPTAQGKNRSDHVRSEGISRSYVNYGLCLEEYYSILLLSYFISSGTLGSPDL